MNSINVHILLAINSNWSQREKAEHIVPQQQHSHQCIFMYGLNLSLCSVMLLTKIQHDLLFGFSLSKNAHK